MYTHRARITIKKSLRKRTDMWCLLLRKLEHLPAELPRSAGATAGFALRKVPQERRETGI